ncbi:MAG: zinc ribbon domain-containing protein, partial [Oscillospiraceae bacterium]
MYVIGAAVMLWVWLVPPLLMKKLALWLRLLADALAVGVYVFLISIDLGGLNWFLGLALPIILLGTAIVVGLGILLRDGGRS